MKDSIETYTDGVWWDMEEIRPESLEVLQERVWEATNSKYKQTKRGKRYVMVMEGTKVLLVLLSSLSRDEAHARLARVKK